MAHTYIKFYENEYRTIELLIRDMDENDFVPDTATCRIEDNEDNVVMEETNCQIVSNGIRVTVPTDVTDVKGIYSVLWTLTKDRMIYRHRTVLNVEELD